MKNFILRSQQHLILGIYAFLISEPFYLTLSPSVELIDVQASGFYLGCAVFLILLIAGYCFLGSFDATLRASKIVTNDRGISVYVVWVLIMLMLCAAWGGTAHNVIAILEHGTASADARISAKFVRWETHGSHGIYSAFAVLDTSRGEIEVRLRGHPRESTAGFDMPFDLTSGDSAVLVGKANSMIFVFNSIDFVPKPPHTP